MSKKIILIVIAVIFVAGIGYWAYQSKLKPEGLTETEKSCLNSGGKISTSLCCNSASNFPNLCLIGACGCPPADSHQIKTCDCGENKCFDGEKCVSTEAEEEEELLSEQPNKAKFDEYFTSAFLAKLPADAEFNPFGIVKTKIFTSIDQFCTSFEMKKTIPANSFSSAVYDKDNEEYAQPKSVFPMELKKGGSVGCEPLSYTAGKYEFKIYIDNVLTAVLPFEVR